MAEIGILKHGMSAAAKASARTNGSASLTGMTRNRDQRLRAMFEGAAIGIATCTLDGYITESNPALAQVLGYNREELLNMHLGQLLPGDPDSEQSLAATFKQSNCNSFRQEKRYQRKNGTSLWCQSTVSIVCDTEGKPLFLMVMLEDATESRLAAGQARQAEKMEVIGRLAGGIAHDFNNLLTGVLLYCDLLSAGIKRGSQLLQHVQEIRLAGEQGAALTQQLLAIARKQVPHPRAILLNEVVSSTENMVRRLIGEQIEFVTSLTPNLPTVLADEAQLRQVLLNLVLNARDAMPQGGRITVATRASDRFSTTHGGVSLLVEDTGCGMDDDTRARLFEPFFTTKPLGQGTGLGLSTVKRIVSESGGIIEVESEAGYGTRIEVALPVTENFPIASVPVRSPAGETILLVDDHSSARNSIGRVLHHAGYRVLQASSGKRALKVFAESPHRVDLLLADWMMPEMTGRELARKLRHQQPELKVILISGYHNPREGAPDASVELIRKPFAGRMLIERVRGVLNSKGDS